MDWRVKPIETDYAGCRFRSRLEARWAVFFDALGIPWEYEPQGYEREGHRYLPDFRLYGADVFVEVKGDTAAMQREWEHHNSLHDFGGCLPAFRDSLGSSRGLILLGPIPRPQVGHTHFHPIIQHKEGLFRSWCVLSKGGVSCVAASDPQSILHRLCNLNTTAIDGPDGWLVETRSMSLPWIVRGAQEAYAAARSARFEHGQSGPPRALGVG